MPKPFNKPSLSLEEHIRLLASRGLIIDNESTVRHYLINVGYYRISGYAFRFQKDLATHTFNDNVTFSDLIEAYNFDRSLRILAFDAIERIEVSFRARLNNALCSKYDPFWFENESLFDFHFDENLATIDKELGRSAEDFIKHHKQTYGHDRPPGWKTAEIMSFGTLSKIYASLKDNEVKNELAKNMGLPNYVFFQSWLTAIATLRNACAHHSRIWEKNFQYPPKKIPSLPLPWIKQLPATHKDMQLLYMQLCSVKYLLNIVSPDNHFTAHILENTQKYPSVNLRKLGFPSHWENEPLWSI